MKGRQMSAAGPPPPPHARTFEALVLATFVLGIALRTPTFCRPLLSDDEAIYAATADALQRGDLLYRDVVDHKPPLIYYIYRAGFATFGRYDTQAAHALVILSVLLTAGFLLAIGSREGPHDRSVGLAAAGLFLIFSTTWHDYDALAANCELFLLAPQTIAAWLLLRDLAAPASGARKLALHLAVGALIGTSALFKYQGLTFLGASVGLLLWWVILRRAPWSWAVPRALCQVLGALLPPAVYLLWCVAAGNAAATIYWFKFNFSYVGAGLTGLAALSRGLRRTALIGGSALVPYALGLTGAVTAAAGVARVLRRRVSADGLGAAVLVRGGSKGPSQGPLLGSRRRLERSVEGDVPPPAMTLGLLWLVTSAVAVKTGGRFFGHYFLLVLPPLCLLAAPSFSRLWQKNRSSRAILAVLCALPAVLFFVLATSGRSVAADLDEREPPYAEVAARIAKLTAPEERIFVWGNSPQLYVLARRPMGTRFSSCNFVTGESPGTPTETGRWDADSNQNPTTWQMLFADLERRRPALLVDAAAAGWNGYDKYPLARYPRLAAYVAEHYRPVGIRAGVVLYRRVPERNERTR
jgi:hypothetical protein